MDKIFDKYFLPIPFYSYNEINNDVELTIVENENIEQNEEYSEIDIIQEQSIDSTNRIIHGNNGDNIYIAANYYNNNVISNDVVLNKKSKREEKKEENRRKYDPDNLLLKVGVHYINFLPIFLNYLLKKLSNYNGIGFLKIEPESKKNINRKKFNETLDKTIKDILAQNISKKYKNYPPDHNIKLCEEIEKNFPIMKNILEQNFLKIFQEIYYPSKREVNLKKVVDIEKVIYLPEKVSMFKDKFNSFNEDYTYKIQNMINEKFFNNQLKFFS